MVDPRFRIAQITKPYLFKNDVVLAQLPAKELNMLREKAKPRNGKRGEVLFRQGEFPKGVFWLINGKVKIYQETTAGEHQTLYIYSDGELIAYRQLIAQEAHPVSAALLENSTIGFIPGKLFLSLLETSPLFARNVRVALARDFTVWMNRMTVFAQYPVRRRLILALLILHEQYYRSGSPGGVSRLLALNLLSMSVLH